MYNVSMRKRNIKTLATLAILISLNIVLSRFVSIKALNFKISFTFLTIVLASYFYGYFGGITVAFFGDLVGALLFPIGPYNPLLSLSAILSGITYAFFFKKDMNNKSIVLACLINRFFVSLIVNTTIISFMYNLSFKATFITRLYSSLIMFVVELIVLFFIRKYVDRIKVWIR